MKRTMVFFVVFTILCNLSIFAAEASTTNKLIYECKNLNSSYTDDAHLTFTTSPVRMAENQDGIWVSSAKHNGSNHANAWVDSRGILRMNGYAWYDSSMNLELNKKESIGTLDKISFEIKNNHYTSNGGGALKLFVNADENRYYYFGETYSNTLPCFYYVENGKFTLLASPDNMNDTRLTWIFSGDIDIAGNVISWTVNSRSPSDTISWSGSYTDSYGLISSNWKYPVSLEVYNGYDIELTHFNIFGKMNGEECTFFDDFSEYSSKYNSEKDAYTLNDKNAEVLAVHQSGAKWVTSTKRCSKYVSNSWQSNAYINGKLALEGYGFYKSAINLDFGDDVYFNSIKQIKYNQTRKHENASHGVGMTFFVNAAEDTFLYLGTSFQSPVPKLSKSVNGESSVVKAPEGQTWKDNVNFDVEVTISGNKISWTITGDTETWSDSYTDTDGIISANWRYPISYQMIGDYYTSLNFVEIDYEVRTISRAKPEKKAYSLNELYELRDSAEASGRDIEFNAINRLDLRETTNNIITADVSVDTSVVKDISPDIAGVAIECGPMYGGMSPRFSSYLDADKNITAEYANFAKKVPEIPSFRLGGGSTNEQNLWASVNNQPSSYVSLPPDYISAGHKLGDIVSEQDYGLTEWLKVIKENNTNASVTVCISPLTTTADDAVALMHFLTDDITTEYGTLRLSKGFASPINVLYLEIGNELDTNYNGRFEWYTDAAEKIIDAVKAECPNIKFMVNGPTAPWSGRSTSGGWLTNSESRERLDYILKHIGNKIDAISMHPYYADPGNVWYPIQWCDEFAQQVENAKASGIIENREIKFVFTEYSSTWDYTVPGTKKTVEWNDALGGAASLCQFANREYVGQSYKHNLIGNPYMFGYWSGSGKIIWKTMYTDLYGYLSDCLAGESLKTTVSSSGADLRAAAIRRGDELKLILVNSSSYTGINLNLVMPNNYIVKEKTVVTAPNFASYMRDANDEDIVSFETSELSSTGGLYLNQASVTVLTFEKETFGDELLKISFDTESADGENYDVILFDGCRFGSDMDDFAGIGAVTWDVYPMGDELSWTASGRNGIKVYAEVKDVPKDYNALISTENANITGFCVEYANGTSITNKNGIIAVDTPSGSFSEDAHIITAVYGKGKLLQTIFDNGSYEKAQSADSVKIMVWRNGFEPLKKAEVINFSNR